MENSCLSFSGMREMSQIAKTLFLFKREGRCSCCFSLAAATISKLCRANLALSSSAMVEGKSLGRVFKPQARASAIPEDGATFFIQAKMKASDKSTGAE